MGLGCPMVKTYQIKQKQLDQLSWICCIFHSFLNKVPKPKAMKNILVTLLCIAVLMACTKPEEKVPEPSAAPTPQPAEFADQKYVEMGKRDLAALGKKDMMGI